MSKSKQDTYGRKRREKYILRLYVAGMSPRSQRAVRNLTRICDEYLPGRYDLTVIDVYKQPVLAIGEQVVAAPTLIKKLPLPLKRFIGDMSDTATLISGLGVAA